MEQKSEDKENPEEQGHDQELDTDQGRVSEGEHERRDDPKVESGLIQQGQILGQVPEEVIVEQTASAEMASSEIQPATEDVVMEDAEASANEDTVGSADLALIIYSHGDSQ